MTAKKLIENSDILRDIAEENNEKPESDRG